MLTFSAICDEFVKAEGFEKKQCTNDAEAVAYAAKEFIPNFEHEEKGKNLDQKM